MHSQQRLCRWHIRDNNSHSVSVVPAVVVAARRSVLWLVLLLSMQGPPYHHQHQSQ